MNKRRLVLACVLAAVVVGLAIYTGKPLILLVLLGPVIIVLDVLRKRDSGARGSAEPACLHEEEDIPPQKDAVLILGTGMLAIRFLSEIAEDSGCPYTVAGLLDETGTHAKNTVNGVRVCGTLSELPLIVGETGAKALLIAARLDEARIGCAHRMAEAVGLAVYALPEEKRNSLNAGYRDLIRLDN